MISGGSPPHPHHCPSSLRPCRPSFPAPSPPNLRSGCHPTVCLTDRRTSTLKCPFSSKGPPPSTLKKPLLAPNSSDFLLNILCGIVVVVLRGKDIQHLRDSAGRPGFPICFRDISIDRTQHPPPPPPPPPPPHPGANAPSDEQQVRNKEWGFCASEAGGRRKPQGLHG